MDLLNNYSKKEESNKALTIKKQMLNNGDLLDMGDNKSSARKRDHQALSPRNRKSSVPPLYTN